MNKQTDTTNPGIVRNAAWMAWSGIVNIANSVVLWMLMARWRDAAEVGQFAAVMSVYTIFLTLCSLGLGPYLTGEIARRSDKRAFTTSATLLIGAWSLLCVAAMALTGYALDQAAAAQSATLALSLAMPASALITVGEAVFTAVGQARVIAFVTTTENLLRTLIPLALLYRGASLPTICASFLLVRLTACAIYAAIAWRRFGALTAPTLGYAREVAAAAPTFAGVAMLAALHWQLGTVLASRLGGETTAAQFGTASRFLIPVTILLWGYISVVQPAASRLAAQSTAALGDFLARGLRLVLAFALPVAVGGILLSRELLVLLFGVRYAESAPALGLLCLSVLPFAVVMIASRGLIATGRQRFDLCGNAAAVVVNVALNLLLIPRFGATGAAAAQLLSVTAMAAVEVGGGTRPLFALNVWRAIWLCRWPLTAMAAAVALARPFGFWAALLGGAVTYLIGLALIWERIRPTKADAANDERPRVLMVGAHPTKTLGGISTLISDILHSPLTREFNLRHIASQADEYGRFGKLALAVAALAQFVWALAAWRPQVVYIHVGGNSSLYRKIAFIGLARLCGRRVLAHFHAGNFEHYFAGQSNWGRKLLVAGLGRADKFIAVSRETERMIKRVWPAVESVVVPNGINTAAFAATRENTAQDVRLLFVGKMGFLKGEHDLLRALEIVAATTTKFRVDLLGQLSASITEVCAQSSVAPLIEQLGPVKLEERIGYFKRADIFVLPTYAEGMPIAVLEAMAAGLPVISTPVGGTPELITNGVEGFLTAPGDVNASAQRIIMLINDAARRRRMGENARAAAQRYDLNFVLAQLSDELREVRQTSVCRGVHIGPIRETTTN